ncbi:MAG: bifunctional YncE family protein/alkaline phosphatase family protein [Puia sp.]|nr:bifunctional YncE family protein/alkaline phosphatase family protein [Puia sp.]
MLQLNTHNKAWRTFGVLSGLFFFSPLFFSTLHAQSPTHLQPLTHDQPPTNAQPPAIPVAAVPGSGSVPVIVPGPATSSEGARTQLPNGWFLSPAGGSIPLSSDLPLNMALAPDGVHLAVTNNGNGHQTIDLIDLKRRRVVSSKPIRTAWLGLAFSKKHPWLYASGGNDDIVIRYLLAGDSLVSKDTILLGRPWPADKISPTGLALDEAHDRLYVVTKEDDALYICNTQTGKPLSRIPLGAEAYTCLLNPVKRELYISAWGGRKVWVYDTQNDTLKDSVATGDHPTDMAITGDGRWLYVANASSNTVSVISIAGPRTAEDKTAGGKTAVEKTVEGTVVGEKKAEDKTAGEKAAGEKAAGDKTAEEKTAGYKVVETLNTALSPDAPIGSTTNSVCLAPGGKTLYIANADNNYLAVFDVSEPGHSHSLGFIPVGWYPTCVRIRGRNILVTNGKGLSSLPNPGEPNPGERRHSNAYKKSGGNRDQYIGSMLKGTLSVIPAPRAEVLAHYTRQVYANTPYSSGKEQTAHPDAGNPIPQKTGGASPIKYVFYVLKENRTYDQVLGDRAGGNGDTSLCLFGRKITPNAHAITEDFVLLDNFYVDAEVSADGHNWSMAGYATDFVEKNWPYNYAGRGGNYDFDGSRPVANPTMGFIWNYCQRAGIPFRNYGEFMDNGFPTLDLLKDSLNYCKSYPGWNLNIQDVYRESIFEHDFDSLLHTGNLPRFSTIYLPNDHTAGLSKGAYTPIAQIADNDLALGRLVEYLSHSPIWKESAIFVLEDDAQDGPDHVDAHRSPAYVISPYVRRHSVNHTMYSTTSILRTMELILGLPPMSQYDAAATPLYSCFTPQPDTTSYTTRPAGVNIDARNTVWTPSASKSAQFDLSRADAVPDAQLNEVLWKAVKGENSVVPEPRRSAFVRVNKKVDDD